MKLPTIATGAATAAGILTLAAAPALAGHDANPSPEVAAYSYGLEAVQLEEVPNSQATGSTRVKALPNGRIQVTVRAEGLAPNLPHAMHLHGVPGTEADLGCPDPDTAAGSDGVVTTVDGIPSYGGILASLTTTGDTSVDSALALDRFPVADEDGSLKYTRTFENAAAHAEAGTAQVVVHGIDFDGSGAYATGDGPFASRTSSLSDQIALETTVPVLCGGIGN